jgi:hypothetical protein
MASSPATSRRRISALAQHAGHPAMSRCNSSLVGALPYAMNGMTQLPPRVWTCLPDSHPRQPLRMPGAPMPAPAWALSSSGAHRDAPSSYCSLECGDVVHSPRRGLEEAFGWERCRDSRGGPRQAAGLMLQLWALECTKGPEITRSPHISDFSSRELALYAASASLSPSAPCLAFGG